VIRNDSEQLVLVERMLVMQNEINRAINLDWKRAGNPWYRAIWVECGEMMDHVGWKWWKHQEMDLSQAQLEVVDILHFGLSDTLQRHDTVRDAADELVTSLPSSQASPSLDTPAQILREIERLSVQALSLQRFDAPTFWALAGSVGLNLPLIGRQYVAKNVLNRFRQDHGYKQGTYRKVWRGREDNEWLHELAGTLDPASSDFVEALYALLAQEYEAERTR